jgi:sRNA-binding regulator protein Hfq
MSVHRKLIRPSIKDVKENTGRDTENPIPPMTNQSAPGGNLLNSRRKHIPAEQTNAESFYYLKQMQTKTPMVIILQDGEQIRGVIEWYDKHSLKVNRTKEPNLLIMKKVIKYMYKQEDETKQRRRKRPLKSEEASE